MEKIIRFNGTNSMTTIPLRKVNYVTLSENLARLIIDIENSEQRIIKGAYENLNKQYEAINNFFTNEQMVLILEV